jgi:hypothetical protein
MYRWLLACALLAQPAFAVFPVVESVVAEDENNSPWSVALPATINAGDCLIIILASDGQVSDTPSTPTDWTALQQEFHTDHWLSTYYKFAVGDEDGTNVTISSATTEAAVSIVYRISSCHATTPPEVGTAAEGSGLTPDPPSLNPVNWNGEETLWIAYHSQNVTSANSLTSGPASYSSAVGAASGSGGGEVRADAAHRNLGASSEDPGVFTTSHTSGSEPWIAGTLAIRPASTTTTFPPGIINSPLEY